MTHGTVSPQEKQEWAMQVLFQSADRFVITTWCVTEKSSEDTDFNRWRLGVIESLPSGFAVETVNLGGKKQLTMEFQILGPSGPENQQHKPSDNSE